MVSRQSLKPLLEEELFRHGVRLFNEGRFYDCHEVLEDLWRPTQGAQRLFLQAIIHFAVGLYHHEQNNPDGAERQLRKCLKKLAGYLPEFEGVNTEALYREGITLLADIVEKRAVNPRAFNVRLSG
jgi:predicted metal-dependent hydrolase